MDDTPLRKRPWFYIVAWLLILLVVYAWQISRMGGFVMSEWDILVDLACIFPILLVFWMAFFSQFVLPVHTFRDRQKIFDRLITYLFGGHGPAIFIRDGQLIKSEGEERKKGPGILWLDSASAAVTRTATVIKQTIGPGVHFTENGEFIAGTVDLHSQNQSVGPKESDKPFDKKKDEQSEEEFNQIQDRRKQVSALTRDGIEVVPNISVTFRVDTGFPKEGQIGSRFGFRIGVTKKEKENEEKEDKEAIRKAILSQGINPNVSPDSPRRNVSWNQLTALLAVDVWREYIAKFTLDELITQNQIVPPTPSSERARQEKASNFVNDSPQKKRESNNIKDTLIAILKEINSLMLKWIDWLDEKKPTTPPKDSSLESPSRVEENVGQIKKTALQIVSEMVKARLTQADVDYLNEHGVREPRKIQSPEYSLLKSRGLVVSNVSISNIRFPEIIEKQIISQWKATWLKNAKAEEERINRQISLAEITGKESAKVNYADSLASFIMKQRPRTVKDTLQTLLMQTRLFAIRDDRLRRRTTLEREEIERILQWMENGS